MDLGENLNQITDRIIRAAMDVHSALGPGLLESAYEACLEYELNQAGLQVDRQVSLPVVYRGVKLECGYRLDLLVCRQVVVEVKAIGLVTAIHEAQVISYLRLSGCRVGLLLNFHVLHLRDGVRRLVNEFPDPLRWSVRRSRGPQRARRAQRGRRTKDGSEPRPRSMGRAQSERQRTSGFWSCTSLRTSALSAVQAVTKEES